MLTFEELLALWNDDTTRAAMTPEQLQALDEGFAARAAELADAVPSDEVLTELTEIRDNVAAIRTEIATRTAQAEQDEATAAALLAEIRGETPDPEGETLPAEDPPAEDPPAEATPPAETPPAETPPVEAIEETPPVEAVAAAVTPYTPRRTPVAVRRPAASAPTPRGNGALSLVASANLGGSLSAGTPIEDPATLGQAFMDTFSHTEGYQGPPTSISVARGGVFGGPDAARSLYGDERFLDRDMRANGRKIAATQDRGAIVAAGGRCVPSQVLYDLPIIAATDARPVRDQMLTRFGADRGGVITSPPPILTDLDGSVTFWTEANDRNPSSPTTKNCLELTCPDTDETLVEAVVSCLTVGNFRARFNPEQVAAWVDLAAVNHARQADTKLLTTIGTGSTQVTTGTILGTARDVLASLDRIIAAAESRNRTADGTPWTFGAPRWLRDQMRVDLLRQMPVGSVQETLAVADATIDALFAARGINPVWLLDGETGQVFGPQGDGPLTGWPSTVVTYLYPEGSWLFLDGGTLDLGIVRDSVLNSTNDVQVFSETFEATHFHGVESYRLTLDTCPDGSVSSTVDIDPCSTGS